MNITKHIIEHRVYTMRTSQVYYVNIIKIHQEIICILRKHHKKIHHKNHMHIT
jgi:hypothetical protein